MLENLWDFWIAKVLPIVLSVIVVARIVVKLTPTPKDDTILESIVNLLKHLGLHVGDEEPPKE